jgi:hypothetical protein
MNKCIQKILLAACIVAMPVATHAGSITPGHGYTRDVTSNVVQGGALEWLKWDVTVGQSIDSALREYGDDGWRLATNSEMASLFNAFGFGSFTSREGDRQEAPIRWTLDEVGVHRDFLDLFGRTRVVSESDSSYASADPLEISRALFGDPFNVGGTVDYAGVNDDYTLKDTNYLPFVGAVAFIEYDLFFRNVSYDVFGVALVRSVSVPEPGTFAILSLGLLGLGLKRRIHRKTL